MIRFLVAPCIRLASLLVGILIAVGSHPGVAMAQVGSPDAALEEIRSLAVRVDVTGTGARLVAADALAEVVRQELARVGILERLPEPRERDCCVLRLDIRAIEGRSRPRGGGALVAYSARLAMGQVDRLGRLQSWVLYWQGSTRDDLVDPRDLTEQLRFATRELAVEFVDRYLALYPIG